MTGPRARGILRAGSGSRGGLCVLCGEANDCAMAAEGMVADGEQGGADRAEPCWCVTERFDPSLIALVPAAEKDERCICRRCLMRHHDSEHDSEGDFEADRDRSA